MIRTKRQEEVIVGGCRCTQGNILSGKSSKHGMFSNFGSTSYWPVLVRVFVRLFIALSDCGTETPFRLN